MSTNSSDSIYDTIFSLSERQKNIIRNFKKEIIERFKISNTKDANPLKPFHSSSSQKIIIHNDPDDDSLIISIYPCIFSYQQIVEMNKSRKDNQAHLIKRQKIEQQLVSSESISEEKQYLLYELEENEAEYIRCVNCKCLPMYHLSDTPSINCKLRHSNELESDSKMVTNESYCISCLKFGTLCLMSSHKDILEKNKSIPKFSCKIASQDLRPISTFLPPNSINKLKLTTLKNEVILSYFPSKKNRKFLSFENILRSPNSNFEPNCEKETEETVTLYLKDIISSFKEKSIFVSHKLGQVLGFQGSLYPDIFLLSEKNRPILVVGVKYLLSVKEENLKPAFGQLLEYMLLIRSTYGLVDVFGILTDFNHWYFCSLEHSVAYAQSSDLEGERKEAISQSVLIKDRKIYRSDPVQYSDLLLPEYIESFIIRGLKSRLEEVNKNLIALQTVPTIHLNNNKNHINISMFPLKELIEVSKKKFELNLYFKKLPTNCTLYSIHQFYRGANGLASLMCYFEQNQINLVVVKSFEVKFNGNKEYYKADLIKLGKFIENEKKGWKAFDVTIKEYKISKKENQKENSNFPTHKSILVLPFCFTPYSDESEAFQTDFSYLNIISPSDFNKYLPKKFLKNVKKYSKSINKVLNNLVDSLKEKNIKYTDVNLRHLGLMPYENNKQCCFKYVLIDHSMNEKIN